MLIIILPGKLHQSSSPSGVAAAWTGCGCRCGACRCKARPPSAPAPCSRGPPRGARSVPTACGPGTNTAGTSGNRLARRLRSPPPSRWSRCWWCSRCWALLWLWRCCERPFVTFRAVSALISTLLLYLSPRAVAISPSCQARQWNAVGAIPTGKLISVPWIVVRVSLTDTSRRIRGLRRILRQKYKYYKF